MPNEIWTGSVYAPTNDEAQSACVGTSEFYDTKRPFYGFLQQKLK
jgi:hypothetical protein